MNAARKTAAAGLAVAAVFGWWGWPAAALAAAVAVMVLPGAGVSVSLAQAGSWLGRLAGRVAARFSALAASDRASMVLTFAGVAFAASGLAWATAPGWGVLAAGICCGAIGVKLERRGA